MAFTRYSTHGLLLQTSEGTPFISNLPFMEFEYSGQDKPYSVDINEIGRPDLIAWKELGDPSLWPYICMYNNIVDPLLGLNNVTIQLDEQGLPMSAPRVVFDGDSHNTTIIDNTSDLTSIEEGMVVIGGGVQPDTYIVSKTANSVVLSKPTLTSMHTAFYASQGDVVLTPTVIMIPLDKNKITLIPRTYRQ